MSATIVTCECGAKVRLPSEGNLRSLRCPKCKQGLPLSADCVVLSSRPLGGEQPIVCPICQSTIDQVQSCVTCPVCSQVHHRDCWAEIGGCSTYGCSEAPSIDKSDQSAETPLAAWGDTKKCPACGETIKAIALRCRYCGTDFQSVDPMSAADLRTQAVREDELKTLKQTAAGLFIVSLVGILAPLILILGLALLVPKRAQLAKSGPLFAIMGWTAIALSAIYTALLVFFFVFS